MKQKIILPLCLLLSVMSAVHGQPTLTELTVTADYDASRKSPIGVSANTVITVLTADSIYLVNAKRMLMYRYLHSAAIDEDGSLSRSIERFDRTVVGLTAQTERMLKLNALNQKMNIRLTQTAETITRLERSLKLQTDLIDRQSQQLIAWEQNFNQEQKRKRRQSLFSDFFKVAGAVLGTWFAVKFL